MQRLRASLKTIIWVPVIAGSLLLSACGGYERAPNDGTIAWSREFVSEGTSVALDVAADVKDNIYVVGAAYTALPGQVHAGNADAFIRKYDSLGIEIWTVQFGSEADDLARLVWVDQKGNPYVFGSTEGALPGQTQSDDYEDNFIRKYDSNGSELWTRQYEAGSKEEKAALGAMGIIFLDRVEDTEIVRQYNAAGDERWTKSLPQSESAREVTLDEENNLYVAGTTGTNNVFVRKYDPLWKELWIEHFRMGWGGSVHGLAVDESKNVYVSGWTDPTGRTGSKDHVYVHKFDPAGELLWAAQFEDELSRDAWSMTVDKSGNVYVVGSTCSPSHKGDCTIGDIAFVRKYGR